MTVQREKYEIQVVKHETDPVFVVGLTVYCKGSYEDRSDALLLIGEAWAHAISEAGFNLVEALSKITREGTMQ